MESLEGQLQHLKPLAPSALVRDRALAVGMEAGGEAQA